jgi:hypothetical protein
VVDATLLFFMRVHMANRISWLWFFDVIGGCGMSWMLVCGRSRLTAAGGWFQGRKCGVLMIWIWDGQLVFNFSTSHTHPWSIASINIKQIKMTFVVQFIVISARIKRPFQLIYSSEIFESCEQGEYHAIFKKGILFNLLFVNNVLSFLWVVYYNPSQQCGYIHFIIMSIMWVHSFYHNVNLWDE